MQSDQKTKQIETMNENYKAMQSAISTLEKKGFRWNAQDDESVYLSRKRGCQTVLAQVDCFDGAAVTVNGMTLAGYLQWLKNL